MRGCAGQGTYQGLCGGEGLQVFGFGKLGDQVLWIDAHLRGGRSHTRTHSYISILRELLAIIHVCVFMRVRVCV